MSTSDLYKCAADGRLEQFREKILELIDKKCVIQILEFRQFNNFTWGHADEMVDRRFALKGNVLAFLCLLGEYGKVRMLLEEFPWLWRCEGSWYVHFMEARVKLPLAMQLLSFFQGAHFEPGCMCAPFGLWRCYLTEPPKKRFLSRFYFRTTMTTCIMSQEALFNLIPFYMPAKVRNQPDCILSSWNDHHRLPSAGGDANPRDELYAYPAHRILAALKFKSYERRPLSLFSLSSLALLKYMPDMSQRKACLELRERRGTYPMHALEHLLDPTYIFT